MKHQKMRPSNRAHTILDTRYPRNCAAIVKSHHKFHSHFKNAAYTFYDPDYIRVAPTDWHEVNQPYRTILMFKDGFKNESLVAVAARSGPAAFRRCNFPISIFFTA